MYVIAGVAYETVQSSFILADYYNNFIRRVTSDGIAFSPLFHFLYTFSVIAITCTMAGKYASSTTVAGFLNFSPGNRENTVN
jgi:hypothetical protein